MRIDLIKLSFYNKNNSIFLKYNLPIPNYFFILVLVFYGFVITINHSIYTGISPNVIDFEVVNVLNAEL